MNTNRILITCAVFGALVCGDAGAAVRVDFFRDNDELQFGNARNSEDVKLLWDATSFNIEDGADNVSFKWYDLGTAGRLVAQDDCEYVLGTGLDYRLISDGTTLEIQDAADNVGLTITDQGTTMDLDVSGALTISGTASFTGDMDIGDAVTDTLTITSSIDADVYVDDGTTNSPALIFKDATDQEIHILKVDASFLDFTDGTNDLMTLTDQGTTGLLTVTGDIICADDLAVNGNAITSDDATFGLLDAAPTLINFGGNASLNIGKAGLFTTIIGKLNVGEATTLDTTVDVTGIATLSDTVKMAAGKYLWFDAAGAHRIGNDGAALTLSNATPTVMVSATPTTVDADPILDVGLASAKMGIGCTDPNYQLELVWDFQETPETPGDVAERGMAVLLHKDGAQPNQIWFKRSRGTRAIPTSVADGTNIGTFWSSAYDGDEYNVQAAFGFAVNGAVADDSIPTDIFFATNVDTIGVIADSIKMRIISTGELAIGTSAPDRQIEANVGAETDGLRLSYDDADGSAENYVEMLVNSSGDGQLIATGGNFNIGNGTINNVKFGTSDAYGLMALGTDITDHGSIILYGNNDATGATLYMYTADNENASNAYYRAEADGDNLIFTDDDSTTILTLSYEGDLSVVGALATSTITTFTADDTTPTVTAGNVFKVPATWTAANDITAFDNGTAGQTITIIGGDIDCNVIDGADLFLAGNWNAVAESTLTLEYDGADWYEISRHAESDEAYGDMYGNDIALAVANMAQNTWYNLVDADMTSGVLSGVTHDGNGEMAVVGTATYLINYSATFSVNAATQHVAFGVEVDGGGSAAASGQAHITTGLINKTEVVACSTILTLTAGQTIEIATFTSEAGGTLDMTVENINVTIHRIGE